MSDLSFSLSPFLVAPMLADLTLADLTLTGTLSRHQTQLALRYQLKGAVDQVVLPPLADFPRRQDGLWQHTCFECFWGLQGLPTYWELNLSPAGHWNLYRFTNYRQGMQVERAIATLPVTTETTARTFTLTLTLDLAPMIAVQQGLEIGMSAVLQPKEGPLSYWALTHPGEQPDFHQRASFLLKV